MTVLTSPVLFGGPAHGQSYVIDRPDLLVPVRVEGSIFSGSARPSLCTETHRYIERHAARVDEHPCASWLRVEQEWRVRVWSELELSPALFAELAAQRRPDRFEIVERDLVADPRYAPRAGRVPDFVELWPPSVQLRWFDRYAAWLLPRRDWERWHCASVDHLGRCCDSCLDDYAEGWDSPHEGLCCCRASR